jgi:tryptophan synthase alpha chain
MTRIDAKFADLKAQGKKAFVAYVMAGILIMTPRLRSCVGCPAPGWM